MRASCPLFAACGHPARITSALFAFLRGHSACLIAARASSNLRRMKTDAPAFATVPMQTIGPLKITGPEMDDEVMVPLATYESPLWPSVERGARVTRVSGGIRCVVVDERMTRSILLEAPGAVEAVMVADALKARRGDVQAVVSTTSRYAELLDIHTQIVGNLLFVRLEFSTGDASGHNMATKAADAVMTWTLQKWPSLKYISVSGNFCCDKKTSAVNGILGRGKYVVAELIIPGKICARYLKTTPEKIAELNVKKNLIGTMLAGGVRTANAHFANMLLAIYLATGQDAANIIEGSQGFVHAEARSGDIPVPDTGRQECRPYDTDLYFSCTLPNIIVGTVGNGKDLPFVQENMKLLGCAEAREPGQNARRLAVITAATVLCGELSLLAALTNPGELMAAHVRMERKAKA